MAGRGVTVTRDGGVVLRKDGNVFEATVASTTTAAAMAVTVMTVRGVNHCGATERRGRSGTGSLLGRGGSFNCSSK